MSEIRLPSPHKSQIPILLDNSRFKVICAGRRFGKNILALMALVEGHGRHGSGRKGMIEGGKFWHVSPIVAQAEEMWDLLKYSLRDCAVKISETKKRIILRNGASIWVKSADKPNSLRGVGLDGVVIDEAAFIKEEVWKKAIRPMLTLRKGWAIFISTPNGMNWFNDIYKQCDEIDGWKSWHYSTYDNPLADKEELDGVRRELGSLSFAQEILAEFVTGSHGVFKRSWWDNARYSVEGSGNEIIRLGDKIVHWNSIHRFATIDLAASMKETADYTVCMTFGVSREGDLIIRDVLRGRIEAQNKIPEVDSKYRQWKHDVIWAESVAYQLTFVQNAVAAGLPVRQIPNEMTRGEDKLSRSYPATAMAEQGKIWLPHSAPWLKDFEDELFAFTGTRIDRHDDQVDCLSYGVKMMQHGRRKTRRDLSSIIPKKQAVFDSLR